MADPLDSSSTSSTLAEAGCEATVDRDGNEGDDERTSELSGTEDTPQRETPPGTEASEGTKNQSSLALTDSGTIQQQQKRPSNELEDAVIIKPMPIRKKHRRGSKRNRRKYRPYSKLSWEEKKAKDERDTVRANKMREKYMHEKGRPTAPYNTTQYLMAEHDLEEPDLGSHSHKGGENNSRPRVASCSMDDSDFDDYNESPEDEIYEQEFFKKDFTEAYEQVHAENLHSMSKGELVHEFMRLEERVEDMEKQLREKGHENGLARQTSLDELSLKCDQNNSSTSDNEVDEELRRLQQENERLAQENSELKTQKLIVGYCK